MQDIMIGVDLAKTVFQIHGALKSGEVKFRKKLTRQQFQAFMASHPPALVILRPAVVRIIGHVRCKPWAMKCD